MHTCTDLKDADEAIMTVQWCHVFEPVKCETHIADWQSHSSQTRCLCPCCCSLPHCALHRLGWYVFKDRHPYQMVLCFISWIIIEFACSRWATGVPGMWPHLAESWSAFALCSCPTASSLLTVCNTCSRFPLIWSVRWRSKWTVWVRDSVQCAFHAIWDFCTGRWCLGWRVIVNVLLDIYFSSI